MTHSKSYQEQIITVIWHKFEEATPHQVQTKPAENKSTTTLSQPTINYLSIEKFDQIQIENYTVKSFFCVSHRSVQ